MRINSPVSGEILHLLRSSLGNDPPDVEKSRLEAWIRGACPIVKKIIYL